MVIPDAGHAPNIDKPSLFNAEVRAFLDHVAAAEGASSTSPDLIRAELADWVAKHWDPGMALRDWRDLLLASGWAVPSWPARWHGRDLPAWADELAGSELIRLGAVGPPVGSGTWLAAPTILAHGSDDLRERLLGPILTGEQTWCQLFSEPGAGSTWRACPPRQSLMATAG